MVVVSMMETSASGEDAVGTSGAASANIPLVESSSTSSRSSWPYETSSANLPLPPGSPISTAASSLSSLAASEAAAAAAAIDIDTYFRGSNGFFTPMQNSYPHGKLKIPISKFVVHFWSNFSSAISRIFRFVQSISSIFLIFSIQSKPDSFLSLFSKKWPFLKWFVWCRKLRSGNTFPINFK